MKIKVIQTDKKNIKPSGLYHNIKFERNQSVNVWIHANVNFFFGGGGVQNHISTVLSLEYSMDKIKWVWRSSHQQDTIAYHIPFKSIENFVR